MAKPSIPSKPRILTGDTPTGRLHLGHYVGSIENRLSLQDSHDCFFIIANTHALTTRAGESAAVREDVLQITMDYLAAGIDPEKSTIFIQSEVPAVAVPSTGVPGNSLVSTSSCRVIESRISPAAPCRRCPAGLQYGDRRRRGRVSLERDPVVLFVSQ